MGLIFITAMPTACGVCCYLTTAWKAELLPSVSL